MEHPTKGNTGSAAMVEGVPARRRRRYSNWHPGPGRGAPIPVNILLHYSKKGKMQRVYKECRRRTTWICPGCRRISLCSDECFLRFHCQLGM
jgi:hypothetical protein